MAVIHLPAGDKILPIEIADAWLGEVAKPPRLSPAEDVSALVERALTQPVGSPSLQQLAHHGQLVAILVDDYTRRTPAYQILPPLLEELHSAGVERGNVRLVMAPGSHRPMT